MKLILVSLAVFVLSAVADYPKPSALTPPQELSWPDAEAHVFWALKASPLITELSTVDTEVFGGKTDAQKAELAQLQKERAGHKSVLDMLKKKVETASRDSDSAGRIEEKRREILKGFRETLEKIAVCYQTWAKNAGYGTWMESRDGAEDLKPVIMWMEKAKRQYKLELTSAGTASLRAVANGTPRKGSLLLSRVFPAGVTLPDKSVDIAKVPAVEFTSAFHYSEQALLSNMSYLTTMKVRSKIYSATDPEPPVDAVRHILSVVFPAYTH
jgi:hypothetical protein